MKKYIILAFIIIMFVNAACFARETDAPQSAVYFSSTQNSSFFDYYRSKLSNSSNILLTSDFIMYIEHLITDYSLRYMENNYLIDIYRTMLSEMINENEHMYASFFACHDAYILNKAYLYTCLSLLDENTILPADIAYAVDSEMTLIEEHRGEAQSNVFRHKEDYSQYIPRGHYNDTEQLRAYFRSMMYFQRMRYRTIVEKDDPYIELKSAMMMTRILNEERVSTLFNDFYSIISFYLQSSDDILISELKGMIPFEINEANLADTALLSKAARIIAKNSQSLIISDIVADNEDMPVFTGIMGQRYIFDSEVFTQLVYNRVGEYTGKDPENAFTQGGRVRTMPRGLDLFYVMGSAEAGNILDSEGDTDYRGYNENIEIMSEQYRYLENGSFYNRMLRQYSIIINSGDFPFLNGQLKKHKELNSMLSSWASLRHDVILYAKQSYTAKITSAGPKPMPEKKHIIAEPYTDFYMQAKEDMKALLFLLYQATGDMVFDGLTKSVEELMDMYIEVSRLTEDRQYYTDNGEITGILNSIDNQLKRLIADKKEKKDNTIIVADVHTDPNSKAVLQEASGYVNEMTVEMNGKAFEGGILSYYEFKHSMNDRLTDEKWREIIQFGTDQYLAPWQRGLFEDNSRKTEK